MNARATTDTARRDYWFEARRPLNCLAFLAPLLVVYEIGVLWVGGTAPNAVRNGADCWLRAGLQFAGFNHAYLLPILVTGLLIAWHLCGRYPWRVSLESLAGMFAESLLFAFCLVLLGQLQNLLFQQWADVSGGGDVASIGGRVALAQTVSFIGAGVYEEVLFRLCLLPGCFGLFRLLLLPTRSAAVLAAVSTSLLFSLAHYAGATGEPFSLFSFTFRALAGLVFALLFMLRGFGITVGSHTAYNVLAGVLLRA